MNRQNVSPDHLYWAVVLSFSTSEEKKRNYQERQSYFCASIPCRFPILLPDLSQFCWFSDVRRQTRDALHALPC
jgi:hypothetical protein